jgi:hypothetical protein
MTLVTRQQPGDIAYPSSIGFPLIHIGCIAAFWTGLTWHALTLAIVLYLVRTFAIGQAVIATSPIAPFARLTSFSSARRQWAAKHRLHHRHSDTTADVHSPVQRGFLYAHVGRTFVPRNDATDYAAVRDLTRYKELMWLDRHPHLPRTIARHRRVVPIRTRAASHSPAPEGPAACHNLLSCAIQSRAYASVTEPTAISGRTPAPVISTEKLSSSPW